MRRLPVGLAAVAAAVTYVGCSEPPAGMQWYIYSANEAASTMKALHCNTKISAVFVLGGDGQSGGQAIEWHPNPP